jgi:hypothetical protein
MDREERHRSLCSELRDMYVSKNDAYGDSFSKTFNELGIISSVTRMNDKMERIKSLVMGAKENDEKLEETLRDLANYAIMTIMEIEDKSDNLNAVSAVDGKVLVSVDKTIAYNINLIRTTPEGLIIKRSRGR